MVSNVVKLGANVHGCFFFFQAEDGIRDYKVTGVQTCALPIAHHRRRRRFVRGPGCAPESLRLRAQSERPAFYDGGPRRVRAGLAAPQLRERWAQRADFATSERLARGTGCWRGSTGNSIRAKL